MDDLEIAEKCPICDTYYVWDSKREQYAQTQEIDVQVAGKAVTLCICPNDNGIVAVRVIDRHGQHIYTPAPHTLFDY